jgi:Domain of unknown function (DUF4124)
MAEWRLRSNVAACAALAGFCVVLTPAALAQEGAGARIYQQRDADGRIVLTDRPLAGAVTQRIWRPAPEDAAAARQRREAARLEAQAVSERIERALEAQRQRDHELALQRVQLADAQARLAAERVRAEAAARATVVFVPNLAARRFPHPPRLPRPVPPRPRLSMPPGLPGAATG